MSNDSTPYRVVDSELLLDAPIIGVRRDTITTATGEAKREIVEHFSAVAVAAVRDNHVMMIRQYRHGVGRHLWEIPAGLLDIDGEDPADAAARELREETGYTAEHLEPLLQLRPSPGGSDELIRIYRARDVTRAPDEEFEPSDEEAELLVRWVPVSDVADGVLSGRLTSGTLVTAILAHLASRSR